MASRIAGGPRKLSGNSSRQPTHDLLTGFPWHAPTVSYPPPKSRETAYQIVAGKDFLPLIVHRSTMWRCRHSGAAQMMSALEIHGDVLLCSQNLVSSNLHWNLGLCVSMTYPEISQEKMRFEF
jgi:hypothetical protein